MQIMVAIFAHISLFICLRCARIIHTPLLAGANMLQTLLSREERLQFDIAKILCDVDVLALGDSGALYEALPQHAWSILLEVYASPHNRSDSVAIDRLKSATEIDSSVAADAIALLYAKGYVMKSIGDGGGEPALWLLVRGQQLVEGRIKAILELARCETLHRA